MIFEHEERMSTMCGLVIDDEYILWSALGEGDLYKTYLSDNRIELEKKFLLNDNDRKYFSCMLRKEEKVYLIELFDGYKIVEYNLQLRQLETLYRKENSGMQVYKAFLIDEKIFLFPSRLKDAVCVYSLESGEVKYWQINWEELLTEAKVDYEEHAIFAIDCLDDVLYGIIDGTSYMFKIEVKPALKCTIETVKKDYKISSINIYEGEKYVTSYGKSNKLVCIGKNGEINEIELGSQSGNKWAYDNVIVYRDKLFVLPNRNENIWIVDMKTRKKKILSYPVRFHRRTEWSLFGQPILHGSIMYLLPHCGNGLLTLDMGSCKIEYFDVIKSDLCVFLNKAMPIARIESQSDCVGKNIYYILKTNR